MTYEQYQEQVLYIIMWGDDSELETFNSQYPEHAARAKQEADTRRGCTYEEYLQRLANSPKHVFVRDQEDEMVWVPEIEE